MVNLLAYFAVNIFLSLQYTDLLLMGDVHFSSCPVTIIKNNQSTCGAHTE